MSFMFYTALTLSKRPESITR